MSEKTSSLYMTVTIFTLLGIIVFKQPSNEKIIDSFANGECWIEFNSQGEHQLVWRKK